MADDIINHEEAWDLAHHKRDSSNLARCYIELRKAAQAVIDNCFKEFHQFGVVNDLRAICETNRDNYSGRD